MEKEIYHIYSPATPQAQAITLFLRKYISNVELIGVFLPNERHVNLKGLSNFEAIQGQRESNGIVHVPTSASSTNEFLKHGDIKIGKITLRQSALRVYNKPWLLNFGNAIGLPIPKTWENVNQVTDYPIFYKQRYEKGGGARGKAYSRDEVPIENENSFIFQEYIDSEGTYGVSFLADEGSLMATHMHFERESLPESGGSAVIIEQFSDARLIKYTQLLVQELKYSGWGLAEFKYCPKRNDYVLMEINAKFWASCEFAFVNEPLFMKLLFNIDSIEKPINQMVFVNRVLGRGIGFTLKSLPLLLNGSKLKVYNGIGKSLIFDILPKRFKNGIKYFLRKLNILKKEI